jgi:hypothetical protein
MKEFMLVAKGKGSPCAFKGAQDRAVFMERFQAWERGLSAKQQFVRSDELNSDCRRLEQKDGSIRLVDGPFTETKELMTGFFLIRAENMQAAIEISKECPVLRLDHIEVYEIKGGN